MDTLKKRIKSPLFWVKMAFSALIIAGICFFFGAELYRSWSQFNYSEFSWAYASMSIGLTLLSFIFIAFIYFLILRAMKFHVSLGESINSHVLGDFASYLPGKVWTVLVRWKTLKGKLRLADSFAVIYLQVLLLILSSAAIILIMGLFFGKGIIGNYSLILYLAIPLVILLAHPRVMGFCINIVLKILKKKQVIISISLKHIVLLTLLCIAYWLLNGLALFFAIRSIYPAGIKLLPAAVIANAASWVISFVSALTPAGLGVKEGITVLLLSSYLPSHILIASSVLFRIFWMLTLFVLVAASVFFLVKSDKLKSIKTYFKGEENEEA